MIHEFDKVVVLNSDLIDERDISLLKNNSLSKYLTIYDLSIDNRPDFIIYPSSGYRNDEAIPEWLMVLLMLMESYNGNVLRMKYNGPELAYADQRGLIHRQPPDIKSMMTISANNISNSTKKYLDKIVKIGKSELVRPKAQRGWFITKQSARDDNFNERTSPRDIINCVYESELNQCEILCLDVTTPM